MLGLFNKKPGKHNSDASSGIERGDFEAVFHEHFDYVLKLALNLCGNKADAEDITQEVFMAVNKGLNGFEGRSQLRTWIYRITIRISGRHLSKHTRMESIDDVCESAISHSHQATANDNDILKVMLKLPLEQRTLISLNAIEGLSHQQVAEILNVPPGTVASRLHTARSNLMKLLGNP